MVAVLAVLSVSMTGLACGSDDDEPETTADTTAVGAGTSAPSDTSPPDPEAAGDPPVVEPAGEKGPGLSSDEGQVLAAVQCYWDTLRESKERPNPDHPRIDECITGPSRERAIQRATELRQLGQAVEDPTGKREQFGTRVVGVEGDTAEVEQCVIDDAVLLQVSNRQVLNDRVISADVRVELRREAGTWRVYETYLLADQEGPGQCE